MPVPPEITLTIPGSPEFVRVARLAAADIGSRAGLDVEEIDDLRIAVDELCTAMLEGATGPLTVVYRMHDGAVEVLGDAPGPGPVTQGTLSRTIVEAVVDEHDLGLDSRRCFRLLKRRGMR